MKSIFHMNQMEKMPKEYKTETNANNLLIENENLELK